MPRDVYAELFERYEAGENPGLCRECNHIQDGCEPDAADYPCENCGEHAVNGVEVALMLEDVE